MTVPVFDGHNDTVLRMHQAGDGFDPFLSGRDGHIDLPRARQGGLAGGLFALFVPGEDVGEPPPDVSSYALPLAPAVDLEQAHETADALVRSLYELEATGAVRVVRSAADFDQFGVDGTICAVLHFEGAEALSGPDELERRYEQGLRSLGLVWSRPNAYGEGVPFHFPGHPDTGPGLTPAGRGLVGACNHLGILVDVSHLNLRGFFDVAALSNAPLVASHSNAHAVCASSRNLTDEQLDAVAESGGLVGVNFAVGFLRPDGRVDPDTPVETIVDHVDYLVERMGLDHVGFGSDFDGARIPDALGDAAGLPVLLAALGDRGYDDDALAKLAHANWLRVVRETWSV